jgi:Leucine-rich repeat (LRR) protein
MNITKLCLWSLLLTALTPNLQVEAAALDPNTPIDELQFKDPGLELCIKDWSNSDINQYKTVGEVKEIACADYGIQSIEGLEVMQELLVIDLSHNPIQDYGPLYQLHKNLGFLWLWGNDVSCEQFIQLRKNLKQTWIGGIDWEDCLQ